LPQTCGVADRDKYNPAMKYPLCAAAAVISVGALAMAINSLRSTDDKVMSQDQEAIDGCWQESDGNTITPAEQH